MGSGRREDDGSPSYAAPASAAWAFAGFLGGGATVTVAGLVGSGGVATSVALAAAVVAVVCGLAFVVLVSREARRVGRSWASVAWAAIKAFFALLAHLP